MGGSSEFIRRWKPRIGDIVSFKHHGYLVGSKKPKFPTLYRIRSDLIWTDVVANWKETKPFSSGKHFIAVVGLQSVVGCGDGCGCCANVSFL
mgnify:FL=1